MEYEGEIRIMSDNKKGLYQHYRPKTFADMFGNEDTIESLTATLLRDDRPHAILLHGPTGCGKTTLARIIATKIGCHGNDFREVDSADFRGIDTIRDIRKKIHFAPLEGTQRVWLLDECHALTKDGQSALLKALEDTPDHVTFILATTDPQKLIPTIKGRCSQFQVKQLDDKQMMKLLFSIVKKEREKITKPVYKAIIESAEGHPRNAIQILQQVLAVEPDKRESVAAKVKEVSAQSIELSRALLNVSGWKMVSSILKELKDQNPESIRRQVLGYAVSVLLSKENHQAAAMIDAFSEPTYDIGFPGIVLACYTIVFPE